MTVLDAEVLELFGRTVRDALAGGGDRTTALLDSGWRDLLSVDVDAAVPLVFRVHGAVRARSGALDDVAIAAMGSGVEARFDELAGAAFVHPRSWRSGGPQLAGVLDGSTLMVDGLCFATMTATEDDAGIALVARSGDGVHLVLAPAPVFERVPVSGLDPSLALVRVVASIDAKTLVVGDAVDPERVDAACRRALAYELIGLATTMLSATSEYAGARVQFGHPIGSFQAVKHRLADVFVALRAAEAAADDSAGDPSEPDTRLAAMAAKCLAGRAFRIAAENCLQVMGAIGFTAEHDLHNFIARGTVLESLYGSAHELRVELGHRLLARGVMPRRAVL